MERLRIEVTESDEGTRLDALVARVGGLPRSRAAELVGSGSVTVDGSVQTKAYRLQAGEVVEAVIQEGAGVEPGPVPEVPVVWEDAHLLVVDKPSGVVVHRGPNVRESTMVDALAASGRPLAHRAGEYRPGIVHRLDRDVSGLLVVAKTDAAHEALAKALAERRIRREYLACVAGDPATDRGTIDAPVGRHSRYRTRMAVLPDGKPAVTHFRVADRFGVAALVEVTLETGRTHQIRTHMKAIGHPILGDAVYGSDPSLARGLGLDRPFLHSARLTFHHPVQGGSLEFTSDLPAELSRALTALRRREVTGEAQ